MAHTYIQAGPKHLQKPNTLIGDPSPMTLMTSLALKHLPSKAQLPGPTRLSSSLHASPSNIWANSTNIFGVNTCGFRFLALGEVALLLGKHVGESVQGLGELRHTCRIEVWCLVMEGLLIHNSNFKQKMAKLQDQQHTVLPVKIQGPISFPSFLLGGIGFLEFSLWI